MQNIFIAFLNVLVFYYFSFHVVLLVAGMANWFADEYKSDGLTRTKDKTWMEKNWPKDTDSNFRVKKDTDKKSNFTQASTTYKYVAPPEQPKPVQKQQNDFNRQGRDGKQGGRGEYQAQTPRSAPEQLNTHTMPKQTQPSQKDVIAGYGIPQQSQGTAQPYNDIHHGQKQMYANPANYGQPQMNVKPQVQQNYMPTQTSMPDENLIRQTVLNTLSAQSAVPNYSIPPPAAMTIPQQLPTMAQAGISQVPVINTVAPESLIQNVVEKVVSNIFQNANASKILPIPNADERQMNDRKIGNGKYGGERSSENERYGGRRNSENDRYGGRETADRRYGNRSPEDERFGGRTPDRSGRRSIPHSNADGLQYDDRRRSGPPQNFPEKPVAQLGKSKPPTYGRGFGSNFNENYRSPSPEYENVSPTYSDESPTYVLEDSDSQRFSRHESKEEMNKRLTQEAYKRHKEKQQGKEPSRDVFQPPHKRMRNSQMRDVQKSPVIQRVS